MTGESINTGAIIACDTGSVLTLWIIEVRSLEKVHVYFRSVGLSAILNFHLFVFFR